MKAQGAQGQRLPDNPQAATSPHPHSKDAIGNTDTVEKAAIFGVSPVTSPSPPSISLFRRFCTLSVCCFTSLVLHLFFGLFRAKILARYVELDVVPAILNSAIVGILWIKLYQWITKERGINPFVVIVITLGSPFVADWLRNGIMWEDSWEELKMIEDCNS